MDAIHSTEEYFTIAREKPLTVMLFSAGWCPDCHFLDRFIDDIVAKYQSQFKFYKVDRDELIDVCQTLDVMGIPSFIVYHEGKIVGRFVNGKRKTRAEVEAFLDDVLERTVKA